MAIRQFWTLVAGLCLVQTADSQDLAGSVHLVGSAELTAKVLRLTPAERHTAGRRGFARSR